MFDSLWTLCRTRYLPCRAFQCMACIWEAREVKHEIHTPVSFHREEHQMSQSLQTKCLKAPSSCCLTDRRNPCSPCSNLSWVKNRQNILHLQSTLLPNQGGIGGRHSILITRTAWHLSSTLVFLRVLLYMSACLILLTVVWGRDDRAYYDGSPERLSDLPKVTKLVS